MSVKNADVLYEKKKAGMRMAPNSQMLFPISLEGKKMLPGVYRGQIVATAGEQKWEWEEKFEITDEEADKYNQLDVSLVQEKSLNWLVIILIVGVIVGLSLLAYFIVKKISQDANQKKQRPNKRRKNGIKKIGAGLMTILDWGVVLLLVLGLLGMLFFCYFCILTVKVSRKLKYFRKRRTKNSKGQKGRNNKLVRLEVKYQKRRLWTIASLIGGLFFLASSLSVDHYQSINLGEKDSRAIVEGYYLLREFASELDRSEKALGSQKKVESNLRHVLTRLSNFGVQNTSGVNRSAGQKKIEQYYGGLK